SPVLGQMGLIPSDFENVDRGGIGIDYQEDDDQIQF
ncbi:MAG: hypothetical protein EZS28_034599, partial [Streblomastix strix]